MPRNMPKGNKSKNTETITYSKIFRASQQAIRMLKQIKKNFNQPFFAHVSN